MLTPCGKNIKFPQGILICSLVTPTRGDIKWTKETGAVC